MENVRDDAPMECRMYEELYPEVEQLVMVKVKQIAEMGAYVSLLEYNGIEGMILLSELSNRRIRSVNKLIRLGKTYVAVVLRVDKDKGYIDLSKRRVSKEDTFKMEDKHFKSKTVHSILKHVAETEKMSIEEIYEKFGWSLYKLGTEHAFDALKLALQDPDRIFGDRLPPGRLRDVVMQNISHRLAPRAVRIRATIEITCFAYDGIDSIKTALGAGLATSTEECPVSIQLLAPPKFVMHVTCLEQDKGIKVLELAIVAIRDKIQELKGTLEVVAAPRAVRDTDEKKLAAIMADLQRNNMEIDGDDDNSDEEDEESDDEDSTDSSEEAHI